MLWSVLLNKVPSNVAKVAKNVASPKMIPKTVPKMVLKTKTLKLMSKKEPKYRFVPKHDVLLE